MLSRDVVGPMGHSELLATTTLIESTFESIDSTRLMNITVQIAGGRDKLLSQS